MSNTPERVTILGAGSAALSAAWHLSDPSLNGKYEVTIYQSGWRAGGLCSSGRIKPENWVNQNGTHYLFGAYDNAFGLCREAYDELLAKGDQRFGTFEEQFVSRNTVVLKQFFKGNWTEWDIVFPTNCKKPGDQSKGFDPNDILVMSVQAVIEMVLGQRALASLQDVGVFPQPMESPSWWQRAICFFGNCSKAPRNGFDALSLALRMTRALVSGDSKTQEILRGALIWLLRACREWLWLALGCLVEHDLDANRLWTLSDLGLTMAIGLLEEDALTPERLDLLDAYDLRAWLTRWGAKESSVWSAPIATWYNSIAAYEDGDISRPNLSTSISIRGLGTLLLNYKGSFAYQISWGIGDSFIAPVYQALKDRGVHFAFFHRIWDIVPNTAGTKIDRVVVERQVELKNGDPLSYNPFVEVKGRLVWPNEPLQEQIATPTPPPNTQPLDSFYNPREGTTIELVAGTDFDHLIGAMGSAVYRFYGKKLAAQKPMWDDIIQKLRTVETQSLRLWWKPTLEELGWKYGAPIVSGYIQPFSTWEDPTPLLDSEDWPSSNKPHTLSHLFGPLPSPRWAPGPEDTDYPLQQQAKAEQAAHCWLEKSVGTLWPKGSNIRNQPAIDWNKLAHHQIRSNPGPVEAYTMIVAGTLQYRPKQGESGYQNFAIAGDWTRTGIDVGSFEGAVISGKGAADFIKAQS